MPGFLRTTEIDTGTKAQGWFCLQMVCPPNGNFNGTNHDSFFSQNQIGQEKWLKK
jgi:hypothetical protein